MPSTALFDIQVVHSVAEIDPKSWDDLSAGRPFTSHRWYRYCEAVLADCEPIYLIVHDQDRAVARATFWRSPNEPLPIESAFLRKGFQSFLRHRPLLMCYSPLSSIAGLILPDDVQRQFVQSVISAKAHELLRQKGCSFLVFSYLSKQQQIGWPQELLTTTVPGPGTFMEVVWPDFDTYMQAGNKKDRQHYKRTTREAEKLGIIVRRHNRVTNIDEALALVRSVEQRFSSAENPWTRGMFEMVEMVDGTFLSAHIGERLVGCGLVLEDNGAQMNTSLGLADEIPYVYFMLVYESLKVAFDHRVHVLRMGSGAYDVKQQLGLSLEDNNSLLFAAANPLLQKTGQWLERFL